MKPDKMEEDRSYTRLVVIAACRLLQCLCVIVMIHLEWLWGPWFVLVLSVITESIAIVYPNAILRKSSGG